MKVLIGQQPTKFLWNWIYDNSSGLNCPVSKTRDNVQYPDGSENGTATVYSYTIKSSGSAENNPYYFYARPKNLSIKSWKRIC